MRRNFLFLITISLLMACTTTLSSRRKLGVQEAYRSYIPAKTAVLGCRLWPATSNFAGYTQSNVLEAERDKFCSEVDADVRESFKSQNFMRGYTPKAIEHALKQSKKTDLLEKITKLWRIEGANSPYSEDIAAFYDNVVKTRVDWRQWLLEFSAATHYSDAVLIPFVGFAREERQNDRGLLLAKRSLGVTLVLIDSQSADLIWVGERQNTRLAHRLVDGSEMRYPEFPEWSGVLRDVLIDSLWSEYPGKIFL